MDEEELNMKKGDNYIQKSSEKETLKKNKSYMRETSDLLKKNILRKI